MLNADAGAKAQQLPVPVDERSNSVAFRCNFFMFPERDRPRRV